MNVSFIELVLMVALSFAVSAGVAFTPLTWNHCAMGAAAVAAVFALKAIFAFIFDGKEIS